MKIVQAITDDGPFDGQGMTKPHKMGANDGNTYMVKFNPNDEPNSNFNEFLGSILAKRMNIPVLESCNIQLDEDFIQRSEYLSNAVQPGTYFATLYVEDGFPISYIPDGTNITNLEKVSEFIVYDVFIYNEDRHPGNTLLIPNSSSSNSKYHYVLIDHGRCFRLVTKKLPYVLNLIPWNTSKITSKGIKNSADLMTVNITPTMLKCIFDEIPEMDMPEEEYIRQLSNELSRRDAADIICAIKNNELIRVRDL